MFRARKNKYSLVTVLAIVISIGLLYFFYSPISYQHIDRNSTVITFSNGEPLRVFRGSDGSFQYPIQLNQVNSDYLRLMIAYEDHDFYHHNGVKVSALLRAIWQWVKSGRIISGGSTLTMQTARMVGNYDRTILGKLQQIMLAIKLEYQLSKDQILTIYINNAPFGGNIKGVEYASQVYFGKSSRDLNLSEAILLSKLPQSPSRYRPDKHLDNAIKARQEVVQILASRGVITTEERELIENTPVLAQKHPTPKRVPLLARHLKVDAEGTKQRRLQSHIDLELQTRIETTLKPSIASLTRKSSLSFAVLHNPSGSVVAFRGSAEFLDRQRFGHVNMAFAQRSPGSTLKPFVYALAIDQGFIHSRSLMADIPYDFNGYKPKNIDDKYIGMIPADDALRASKNIAAVQLLNAVGSKYFVNKLSSAEIELSHLDNNLSIILGGTGVSLMDLLSLYSALANRGKVIKPSLSVLSEYRELPLLSQSAAFIVWKVLSDNKGPNFRVPKYRRKLAWKTGTSYGYRDAWAVGVSPDYTVAVWVGRPDGTPVVGQYGRSKAGPLLYDIFDQLPKDKYRISPPEQVTNHSICWPSGLAYSESDSIKNCEQIKTNAFAIADYTPRTIDLQGKHIMSGAWPEEIRHFKGLKYQDATFTHRDDKSIKIMFPENGMQFFKSQVQNIQVQVSQLDGESSDVLFYLNDSQRRSHEIDITTLGKLNQLVACLSSGCDKVDFIVHDK